MESNEILDNLPQHLKDFIIDQPYNSYTARDHALWRYVMKQNVDYLKNVAHGSYLDGLDATGISVDHIPHMYGMNRILQEIGWAACAVDGFIPPAAFMEFQAFNVLVIAADIRPIDQIEYTPAPDIIHEAAGHAPIIANEEYSEYLRLFGELGSKAFSSAKDYELYEAIRHLSILKADPYTKKEEIDKAQLKLEQIEKNLGAPSEMALIRNLHWWTVEYGLIGKLNDPKIYGAGLLSSVGESQNCLSDKVKKIPLTIDCINYSYDITEQQPQLFVTNDFSSLNDILFEFEKTMSYKNEDFIDDRNHIKDSKNKITKLNTLNDGLDETKIIELYEMFFNKEINEEQLKEILDLNFPNEWLLRFELYRNNHHLKNSWVEDLRIYLKNYNKDNTDLNKAINRGLELI